MNAGSDVAVTSDGMEESIDAFKRYRSNFIAVIHFAEYGKSAR